MSPQALVWHLGIRHREILDEIAALENAIQGFAGVEAQQNMAEVEQRYQELRSVKDQIKECEDAELPTGKGKSKPRKPRSVRESSKSPKTT